MINKDIETTGLSDFFFTNLHFKLVMLKLTNQLNEMYCVMRFYNV